MLDGKRVYPKITVRNQVVQVLLPIGHLINHTVQESPWADPSAAQALAWHLRTVASACLSGEYKFNVQPGGSHSSPELLTSQSSCDFPSGVF